MEFFNLLRKNGGHEKLEDYRTEENGSYPRDNITFKAFLSEHSPEYINVVSEHWLFQERPSRGIQVMVSLIFFVISFVGNACQILVFVAYAR